MCRWTIGKACPVMTVDTLSQEMIAIIAKTASVIIAAVVVHTVRFAIRQFVWDAAMNVRAVTSLYVGTAQRHVLIAKKRTVRIVLTKSTYVMGAKKQERNKKMKNSKKKKYQSPTLRFSPTAWAKLVFLRDMTDNEVGGFGITEADDLLFVTDIALVKQKVTSVTVSFNDDAVANFFEDQVEAGRKPEQFARIWLHTHPGDSPQPSCTDESTFQRVFGSCDWSVMAIVAQQGSTYARLRFNAGPGGETKIPVCVDYSHEFDASSFEAWKQQYLNNVIEDNIVTLSGKPGKHQKNVDVFGSDGFDGLSNLSGEDLLSELDSMDPMEREYFMEELSIRSDFWDEYESEVFYE